MPHLALELRGTLGQFECEFRSLAGLAFGPHAAPVRLDKMLDYIQPDAGTAGLAGVAVIDSMEPVEDSSQMLLGYPDALVFDGHPCHAVHLHGR